MKNVAVVMSTYNGEQYLSKQLDSLVNQVIDKRVFDYNIYCRDDGSKDRTREILKDYAQRYQFIHVIADSGNNKGVNLSFRTLLKDVEADFYFFCDQDDIWMPTKVKTYLARFMRSNNSIPCGVYSDLQLVDQNNKSMGQSMMRLNHWAHDEIRDFPLFVFKCRATGAAFAINKITRDYMIKIPEGEFKKVRMHDAIASQIIASYDNLQFIPQMLVNYRQHGNNVVGAYVPRRPLTEINGRVYRMRRCFNDLKKVSSVIDMNRIPPKNMQALISALTFSKSSFFLKKIYLMIRDYRKLWYRIELKRVIFLILFYKPNVEE